MIHRQDAHATAEAVATKLLEETQAACLEFLCRKAARALEQEAPMTCKHCGVEMLNASAHGSIEYFTHPGGPCASQPVLLGDVTLTREEVLALKRVAQAQLEMEEKRVRNG